MHRRPGVRLLGLLLSAVLPGTATGTDLAIGVCAIPGAEAATCADYDFFDLTDARLAGTPWINEVSGDGSTLAGTENERPYRWIDGKAVEVPIPADFAIGEAEVISHDGRSVAGTVIEAAGPAHAFHWNETQGFRLLEPPSAGQPWIYDMSPNGQWVVGVTNPFAPDMGRAVRWENGTVRLLAGDGSSAHATNDATTVGYDPLGGPQVRWDADGTPDVIGLGTGGRPWEISPDGHIIVGEGEGPVSFEFGALRWDDDEPTLLPGDGVLTPTAAHVLSSDGSLIVGQADNVAVVWQDGVMRRLDDVLSDDLGVALGGHTLRRAYGVSEDGRVVIGQARDADNRTGNFVAVLSPKLGLDVAPDDPTNTVDLGQGPEIEVVVFGSDRTDVADLDVSSLAFGPGAAPATSEVVTGDVNGDGFADRRFAFSLASSGLELGTAKTCLHGRADGHPFRVCSAATLVSARVPALPLPWLVILATALLGSGVLARRRGRS